MNHPAAVLLTAPGLTGSELLLESLTEFLSERKGYLHVHQS